MTKGMQKPSLSVLGLFYIKRGEKKKEEKEKKKSIEGHCYSRGV